MATVLPFAGMRPRQELAEEVAAPPYDVISSDEARRLAGDNPLSFLHISKPEIDLPADTDVHSAAVYDRGRENIRRFIDDGVFQQDASPCFYIYRQAMGDHSQTGVVGLVSADEYEQDIIRKHELTRPEKENDRVRHMEAVQAQTGPVFMTYRSEKSIEDLVEQCCGEKSGVDFVADGVRHQLWVVSDPALQQQITRHFSRVPALFVADGHHRSAAAVRYRALRKEQQGDSSGKEPWNYFMAVLFPHDQLNILGYHRVVRDLGSSTPEGFLAALETQFDVRRADINGIPERAGQFGLYLQGEWYLLDSKSVSSQSDRDDVVLDVAALQDQILAPLLGIGDPRTDARVDFIGGIRGQGALEKAVDSGEFAAAFACYPVAITQLMAIAGQGKLMPPKSTWFEPKLKSGLIIHYLG